MLHEFDEGPTQDGQTDGWMGNMYTSRTNKGWTDRWMDGQHVNIKAQQRMDRQMDECGTYECLQQVVDKAYTHTHDMSV